MGTTDHDLGCTPRGLGSSITTKEMPVHLLIVTATPNRSFVRTFARTVRLWVQLNTIETDLTSGWWFKSAAVINITVIEMYLRYTSNTQTSKAWISSYPRTIRTQEKSPCILQHIEISNDMMNTSSIWVNCSMTISMAPASASSE